MHLFIYLSDLEKNVLNIPTSDGKIPDWPGILIFQPENRLRGSTSFAPFKSLFKGVLRVPSETL